MHLRGLLSFFFYMTCFGTPTLETSFSFPLRTFLTVPEEMGQKHTIRIVAPLTPV